MAYCTHTDVSYALRNLFPSVAGSPVGFDASTTPSKAEVDTYIDLADAEIDMALAEVGFVLPLTAITGETISTQQTNVLKLMSIMGAARMVVDALKPAPAMGPERYPAGNIYGQRFEELRRLLKSTAGFGIRALTYAGKKANSKLATARAPQSSFREGLEGVGDTMGIWDFTVKLARDWHIEEQDAGAWDWDTIVGWQSFT